MNKIQTKQCEQCKQNKEGITFEVPIIDTEPQETTSKHYCWIDLTSLLEKELNQSEDWERNKKKIFRKCLTRCQKKEVFDWPFIKGTFTGGDSTWDRYNTICVQCNISLHWDVTPYKDSNRHACSYCSNCNKIIEGKDQPKHFDWNEEVLPVYKCEKKELIKPSKYYKQANCLECDQTLLQEKGVLKNIVSDIGSVMSCVYSRTNSKAHCAIITKRHVGTDLRHLSEQEWEDVRLVLKDSIAKIDKVYPNIGHAISIPVGRAGGC